MTNSSIVLSVSQLTRAIKLHLENQFPNVLVQGEISNFKKQSSNHLYFTLKDSGSQIQCAMFSSDARLLKKLPKNGDQVQLRGEINVYPPRGNYQIIVRKLQFAGVGELLEQLQERKEKFLKLGYFDSEIKKKLPTLPKTIGVITSPTGAVISDILQILHRRAHGFHVILNPVRVQGEGAAGEIARAIEEFNSHKLADVLIVGRGGGSLEDLWAFNEESVVTAIYKSQIPIIAAIGHETDTTLSDLAADLRAPTPSAAAELAISEKEGLISTLNSASKRLDQIMLHSLSQKKSKLQYCLRHPFILSPVNYLRTFQQRLDEMQFLMDQSMEKSLNLAKDKVQKFSYALRSNSPEVQIQKKIYALEQMRQKIDYRVQNLLQEKVAKFKNLCTHLTAIDPKNLLKKGYSILFDEKRNCAIVSAKDISLKQKLKLILSDGSCEAVVESVNCTSYEKRRS